jgi:PAS domain S-box-containing protein
MFALMDAFKTQFLEALSQEQILGTIPSGLFLVDNDRRIVSWNREAERITGYGSEDVVGKHCSFLEGIECGNICGLYDEGAPEKPIVGAECRIRSKSGEEVIISKNVDFLYSGNQVIGGIESFIDISQQKRQEEKLLSHGRELEETVKVRTEALRSERSRLRSVLDGMLDPAYIVSKGYRLEFLNKPMEQLVGASTGKLCYEIIQGQTKPCKNCPWPKIKKETSVHEERRFGMAERVYEIIHTPLRNSEGTIDKLAVCRDITERKEAACKLMEANKQLDAFAHTVSHDLRTPLTGVICYSELLRDNYADVLGDDGVEMISEVESQGQRMLNIINDMLSFSVADHIDMSDSLADTGHVTTQVLHDVQFEINKKKVEVVVGELPKVRAPQSLLYEVISNLVVNALKYGCKPGGKIEITGESGEKFASINVIDHGQGIPEDERDNVFRVFARGSTSEGTYGTGIGLATVRKIIDRLQGKVLLKETAGGGCTFTVMFPVDIKLKQNKGLYERKGDKAVPVSNDSEIWPKILVCRVCKQPVEEGPWKDKRRMYNCLNCGLELFPEDTEWQAKV